MAFWRSLKHYLEVNRGKNVVTADLIKAMRQEAATIGAIVAGCRAAAGVLEVIVVDDGSADDTAGQARVAGAEVLRNAEKQPMFTVPERVEMLREVTKQWGSVEVEVFDGLLVDFARKRGAGVILRGIRAVSDYEYELQMALMNRKLEPRLETVFMIPGEPYSYLSAKLVREIAQFGAPLKGLVPPIVEERLRTKMS